MSGAYDPIAYAFKGSPMTRILDETAPYPPKSLLKEPEDTPRAFVKIPGLDPHSDKAFTERQAALPNLTKAELLRLQERVAGALEKVAKLEKDKEQTRLLAFKPGVRVSFKYGTGTIVAAWIASPDVQWTIDRYPQKRRAIIVDGDGATVKWIDISMSDVRILG